MSLTFLCFLSVCVFFSSVLLGVYDQNHLLFPTFSSAPSSFLFCSRLVSWQLSWSPSQSSRDAFRVFVCLFGPYLPSSPQRENETVALPLCSIKHIHSPPLCRETKQKDSSTLLSCVCTWKPKQNLGLYFSCASRTLLPESAPLRVRGNAAKRTALEWAKRCHGHDASPAQHREEQRGRCAGSACLTTRDLSALSHTRLAEVRTATPASHSVSDTRWWPFACPCCCRISCVARHVW